MMDKYATNPKNDYRTILAGFLETAQGNARRATQSSNLLHHKKMLDVASA